MLSLLLHYLLLLLLLLIPLVSLSVRAAISPQLFSDLEELARIVDISYCVAFTGIQPPFSCAGRCHEFPTFELIETWNTGPLLSDSCGYIAYDHSPSNPRIVVAFRGTYSLASTIADLSTIPQEYTPYPGDSSSAMLHTTTLGTGVNSTCTNCTVHSGFLRSWINTRSVLLPPLSSAVSSHPHYALTLVGHSLGGAVALLAALELRARGTPAATVTTFGEPKVGNGGFVAHVDELLVLSSNQTEASSYRRVTHVEDPVPLLPLTEWGYAPHAGEVYISKSSLPASVLDVQLCSGDRDGQCSASTDGTLYAAVVSPLRKQASTPGVDAVQVALIPSHFRIWQLLFAHRDYFTRLGVCFKGPFGGVVGGPQILEPDVAINVGS